METLKRRATKEDIEDMRAEAIRVDAEEANIRIAPVIERCTAGHDRRMTSEWQWIAAPPHVKVHIQGTFTEVFAELTTLGYSFRVEPIERWVSLWDWGSNIPEDTDHYGDRD